VPTPAARFRAFPGVFRYNGDWRQIGACFVLKFIDNLPRCTIASINLAMTGTELDILRLFRDYGVTAHQMLFFPAAFSKPESRKFTVAMQSMIERGLVVRERNHEAFSLTARGYREALKLPEPETADCSR
jgi:hypothetical protein